MIAVEKVIVLPLADGNSTVEVTFAGHDGKTVVSQFTGRTRTAMHGDSDSFLRLTVEVLSAATVAGRHDPAPEVA